MKPPLPRTLFGRLMLIWLLGMSAVVAVSLAVFVGERDRHGREVLSEGIAREIVAAVDVLDRLSPSQRAEWIETLGRRRLRLALAPPPPDAVPLPDAPLAQALRRALPEHAVTLLTRERDDAGDARRPRARGFRGAFFVSLALADGTPLTVRLPGPLFAAPPPPAVGSLLAGLLALVAGIAFLSWLAVRVATRPLARLAAAADALGADPERAALELDGPSEVARAAQAFRRMQQRIRAHVAERTRILAAISHDLQTPITRLRLRAEQIDDAELRGRVQSDLDAMQALAREGLDYARSLDAGAPPQPIDLEGLLASLCADAGDMGYAVSLTGHAPTPFRGRVDGLRRALWNLIDNGVKFGRSVDITLAEAADGYTIALRDHGEGLPEAELERVFEPFYRTESSRNRDTGGTGLGLAIARNLIDAHGGEIRLANAPGGGLLATVRLPAQPRP